MRRIVISVISFKIKGSPYCPVPVNSQRGRGSQVSRSPHIDGLVNEDVRNPDHLRHAGVKSHEVLVKTLKPLWQRLHFQRQSLVPPEHPESGLEGHSLRDLIDLEDVPEIDGEIDPNRAQYRGRKVVIVILR